MRFIRGLNNSLLGWHLLGWTLFIVYRYWGELGSWEDNWLAGTDLLAHIVTFYVFYLLVFPRLKVLSNSWLVAVSLPLGTVGFVFFRYVCQEVLMPLMVGFGNYLNEDLWFYFYDNVWRGLYVVSASLLSFFLLNLQRGKTKREQLETERTESELAFLRSQVNPHFLFNTLSYLHTEAFMIDQKLAGNILRLSDILRYATQNSKVERRTVAEEVALLNNYIEIFRQRFEGRCYLNFAVEGDDLEQEMEPLLLMPFVENAFKHGRYVVADTPIEVSLVVKEGTLNFSCRNSIKQEQKDEVSGIGLENIRRRLELLYPGRYELRTGEADNYFTATLSLQL